MQLIIFYLHLMLHAYVQRFDVIEKSWKVFNFSFEVNKALDYDGGWFKGRTQNH
jgi:hypothetical protein